MTIRHIANQENAIEHCNRTDWHEIKEAENLNIAHIIEY